MRRALAASLYREVRHVRVEFSNNTVILNGKVSNYYMKQMAQETVRHHLFGLRIRNELLVIYA